MGQTQYERVPQDQCPDCGHEIPFPNRRYRVNKRRLFFRCIALVLSLLLAFFIGTLSQHMRREQPNGIDIAWAPELVDKLSTKYTRFRGAFNFTDEYRGSPSPEIDAAWERYDFNPMLRVSAEDINTAVRGEKGYLDTVIEIEGGGYLGTIEVFHQLHCLNMVRKATYHDYYKDKGMYGNQTYPIWRTHIDHCIEIIRQIISCNSDTGLIAFHWVEGNPNPYPDMNTWHQCRDVEMIHDWAMTKQAANGIDPISGIIKRPGVNELRADP